ncbi:hypothetical protein EYZ11_013519 [Aspergillus tanneri]|uniref:Tf2-1-like SH3-like domain-containing protein n=1 Tax=Aspergillus tanneri TaxID=1220188 RepID=A0A4S3IXG7_9EURO|nr:hypothetical protein EYZ11_013519 [Aspergillus tanneri]
MVITDRLGKGVIIKPCENIETEYIVRKFLKVFYAYHGLPSAIVSDRDNWAFLCPAAMLALNNRDSASTGVSPFFLDHGYHMEPLDLPEAPEVVQSPKTPAQRAEDIVSKLKGALELAQAAMAAAQLAQEEYTNQHRNTAPQYQVGDKVWLDLRNIKTNRPCKKLDAQHAKFTIIERVGSHAYKLDIPTAIHPVFHTMLLRPAARNPLPSQSRPDWQPPGFLVDGEKEYGVDEILDERRIRWGRG